MTYILEITKLAKGISSLFGEDIEKLGEVTEIEFKEDNWVGEAGKLENIKFRLVSLNGYIQLYIDQEGSLDAT